MNQLDRLLSLMTLIVLLTACTSSRDVADASADNTVQSTFSNKNTQIYFDPYEKWKGTPYKYGGNSRSGVDCSAFVQAVFLEAQNEVLPRTTVAQSKLGNEVHLSEAKSGDLIFFKTTRKDRHVGIYLGKNRFMHASTSKGVIISRLNNPYWASVFWQVRRVN